MFSGKSSLQILQEFRGRVGAGNQEAIPRPGAGDIEKVPLGVVDFFEIRHVSNALDSLLKGQYLVIAGHDHDGAKLQPLGKMHN